MLDEEHETPEYEADDPNIYTCGQVGKHNVVIACLPEGQTGTHSAAAVAVQMKSTFPSTRFGLMVGIGGGVPSEEADIRLGDVVVSKPHKVHGGVVQYDFGKTTPGGRFERTGSLNTPPTVLLNAVANLRARHMRGKSRLSDYLSKFDSLPDFTREAAGSDTLFDATYTHTGGPTCAQCDRSYAVPREPRRREVVVHYGTIASGNQVMRSATERDKISADLGGVLCFEMEAAGLMNSFPCLVIRGICDYADSHKNKRWQAYAAGTASACAKEVLSVMLPAEVAQTRKAEFEIASHEFLPLLYENTCIYEESKIRNRQRVPGTCEWFTNHELFKKWNSPSNSQIPRLLYVTADPGCGKSVLSRYLIDEILPRAGRTVCFFFFKDDFEQQKSSLSALCCLLHQLFDRNPHLLTDDVLTEYVKRGKGFFGSFENLWHTFVLAADNQETVCVLDALDECADRDRRQLIDAIAAICNINSSKTNQHGGPRVLLTSRPYEHIRAHLSIQLKTPVSSIHLQGDQGTMADAIAEEIQLVLDSRIDETAKFFCLEPDERALMKRNLQSVPNRTYLWITLVFDGLMKRKSGVSKHDILNLLRQPPKSVYDVYEQILNKSPDRQDARRLLHIIIGARRPLSLAEMSIALAFKNKESVASVSERIIPHSRIGTYVRGLCGLFATIVDEKVYLLHQTAREFLLDYNSEDPRRDLQHNFDNIGRNDSTESYIWQHSIAIANSHRVLAQICISYLLSKVVNQDLPPFEYAAIYWVTHYRQAPDIYQMDMAKEVKDLCLPSGQLFQWIEEYEQNNGIQINKSPLCVASALGLEEVAKLIITEEYSIRIDPEEKLSSRISPIRKLLQPKWSLKTRYSGQHNEDVHFAMNYAASAGHQTIVKLLLRIKDNIEIEDKRFWYGEVALHSAAQNGHADVVKLLLESKVRFDTKGYAGRTPLWSAAEHGHTAVVKLLLERAAQAEIDDVTGQTPLSIAAERGHVAVVKLLLESKATTETKSNSLHNRPLLLAATNGHEAVVKLLLERTAQDEVEDAPSQTPLSIAAQNGHVAVVELLLERKVRLDTRDIYGRTPLWYAAQNGHVAVVRLLLQRNADTNSKDKWGRTPLWGAVLRGHESVVRQLLEDERINVDLADMNGQSPLSHAAEQGREGVVRLLIETGQASINLKDNYGNTPMS